MSIPLRELTPEKRGAIARDYGDHAITVAAILARHDVNHRTLYGLAPRTCRCAGPSSRPAPTIRSRVAGSSRGRSASPTRRSWRGSAS